MLNRDISPDRLVLPALLLLIVLIVSPNAVFWVLVAELVVIFSISRKKTARPEPQLNPDPNQSSTPVPSQTPEQTPAPNLSSAGQGGLRDQKMDVERLQRLEQLAAVGQLTASLAHEVNNPLAFIRSNLEEVQNDIESLLKFIKDVDLIADRIDPSDPTYQALGQSWSARSVSEIQDELPERVSDSIHGIQRIAQITQGMKSLISGVSAPKKYNTSLNEELQKVLRIVRPRLKNRIQLQVNLLDQSPALYCSPCQIGQVLLNLIINAVQVMGDKDGNIHLSEQLHDQELEIRVVDDGPGMTDEVSAQAFEPFFTTREKEDGTGIGLSLSKQIIEDHGGRIELETAPGEGCCFRIFLPLRQEANHVQ